MNKTYLFWQYLHQGGVMSVQNKKMLSTIVYYTLVVLALASAGFFIYCLVIRDVAMWAKVIYFIWSGLVIGVIIFDILCTSTREAKTVSGLIIYILSVLAVIMSIILYFSNAGMDGLATGFFNLFLSVSLLSLMTTGYMIATWCVGESLVEHKTAEEKIDERVK